MTETSLKHYLRLAGWAAIIATFVNFAANLVQRAERMSEIGVDNALRADTFALFTFGFGVELPLSLTIACLCLMAARTLTFKQQTLKSIFE